MQPEEVAQFIDARRDTYVGAAYRMTRNRADAEDAVQEACMKAVRAADGIRLADITKWFRTVLANTCVDLHRRRQVRIPSCSLDMPLNDEGLSNVVDTVLSCAQSPLDTLLSGMIRERIFDEILLLPNYYKEAFVLCEVHGLGYEEVSATIRVPIGTVKSRVHRARLILREKLRELA